MIIDMHTHAGRSHRTGNVDRSVLTTMREAGIAAAVVAAIADIPVIRRGPNTKRLVRIRDPEPGECLAATEGYLDSFSNAGMRIARKVVQTGGPSGASPPTLPRQAVPGMIRHMVRAIDAAEIDHVGTGTDLPAGVAKTEMPDFFRHAELAEAPQYRGMTAAEVEKSGSGDGSRVFRAVRG